MAAASTRRGSSGIFWMNGGMDEDLSLNSGSGCPRNTSRKGTRMQSGQSVDVKNKVSLKKGVKKPCHFQDVRRTFDTKENVSFHSNADVATEDTPLPQVIAESRRVQSQVCLKDLCPEDKRRIANLIEELARVSEEKEESMQRLKDEHENFERKIHQLEKQNVVIAQERESQQQQYRECQELLALYQQYLSEQQVKLNQSIAQLTLEAAHSKVLTSEEAPSRATGRANAPLFDGSYLSCAAPEGQRPEVHRSGSGRGRPQHTVRRPSSSDSEFSPTDDQISRQRIEKLECREPRSTYPHRCEQYQDFCQDSGYGTHQRRGFKGHSVERSHQNTFNHHKCERLQNGNGRGLETKGSLTSPLLGHEDWEEKRHQLLLQKMQLEMEREKLQARLAEQEERLNRQNQQLSQSQLDYNRFQESSRSELGTSNSKNGKPQSEGTPHQNLPSSACEDAAVHPAQQSMHEKCPQSAPPLDNIIHARDASTQYKKDVATSPAKSPVTLAKSTSLHATEGSVNYRVDFSVVELLDIFSPTSAASQRKPSSQRLNTSQRRPALTTPKPVPRSLLTPAGQHLPSRQDLEESQILEDIFFIC